MEMPKEISQEEVISRVEADIQAAFKDIEEQLPFIGHGEAKRLLIAATKYPLEDSDFSGESDAMIRAFSASKTVKDALVALGVEVVIKQMIENQQRMAGIAPVIEENTEEVNNG